MNTNTEKYPYTRPDMAPEDFYRAISGAAMQEARGNLIEGLVKLGAPGWLRAIFASLIADYEMSIINAFVRFDAKAVAALLEANEPEEVAEGKSGYAEALADLRDGLAAMRERHGDDLDPEDRALADEAVRLAAKRAEEAAVEVANG